MRPGWYEIFVNEFGAAEPEFKDQGHEELWRNDSNGLFPTIVNEPKLIVQRNVLNTEIWVYIKREE